METNQLSPEQRLEYLIKQVVAHKQIWILSDDDGCVMLNTEDEDCAPVWPSETDANLWATGDWQDCQPRAIDLKTWLNKWTLGLEGDDVSIAVFPNEQEEGLVISAQELDFSLRERQRKQKSN